MIAVSEQLAWRAVPHEVARLYSTLKPTADIVQETTYAMPKSAAIFVGEPGVYIQTDYPDLWSIVGDRIKTAAAVDVQISDAVPNYYEQPWALVKAGGIWDTPLKDYTAPVASAVAAPQKLLGGPNPLTTMLMGGLLGGGLGYGGGWLAEKIYGDKYLEEGTPRRNLALMGAMLGAGGPALFHAIPAMQRKGWAGLTDKWPLESKSAGDRFASANAELAGEAPRFYKDAQGGWGGAFTPIPVGDFNQAVWNDVPSAFNPGGSTSPVTAALTTGLISGAASQRNNSPFVTPLDVGRLAIGMGSGLASAKLFTGIVGPLAGLTPYAREKLQQAGMWAGALQAATGGLFG